MLVTCGSVTGLISGLCLGKLAKYSLEKLQSDLIVLKKKTATS